MLMGCVACVCNMMSELELGNSEVGVTLECLGYCLEASYMTDNLARRS